MENKPDDKIIFGLSGVTYVGTPEERHAKIIQEAKAIALEYDGTDTHYEDYIGCHQTSNTVLWGERIRQAIGEAIAKVQADYAASVNRPIEEFDPYTIDGHIDYERDRPETSVHLAWSLAREWGADS